MKKISKKTIYRWIRGNPRRIRKCLAQPNGQVGYCNLGIVLHELGVPDAALLDAVRDIPLDPLSEFLHQRGLERLALDYTSRPDAESFDWDVDEDGNRYTTIDATILAAELTGQRDGLFELLISVNDNEWNDDKDNLREVREVLNV